MGSESSSTELFAPGAEEYYRKVLGLMPKRNPDLKCTCGCLRSSHMGKPRGCNPHGFHEFVCDHSACGWKPRGEEPKPCAGCGDQHEPEEHESAERHLCGSCDIGLPMSCTCGPDEACGDCPDMPPEDPPLTPEQEEEAPCPHESWEVTSEYRDLLTRRWVKSRRCADCGEELDNLFEDEPHWDFQPVESPPEDPPPPQPDRRPPYAVHYSVQGHLFEVALPGDATVKAVDGALVILHHLGPVAGIVQVLPVLSEES